MSERKWPRGELRRGQFYVFYCGRCTATQNFYHIGKRKAVNLGRAHGWRETEEDGWVCPGCRGKR